MDVLIAEAQKDCTQSTHFTDCRDIIDLTAPVKIIWTTHIKKWTDIILSEL